MSLIRRSMLRHDETRSVYPITTLEELARIVGGTTATVSGSASIDNALQHHVVYRSVNKISGIVAGLPLTARVGRTVLDPQPPLIKAPSVDLRPTAWKRALAASLLLDGNGYGLVSSPDGTNVERLELLHPCRVCWTKKGGWTLDDKPTELWPLGPLWQVPLFTMPGSPVGLNPLHYARRTTYAGLAAKEFGGNFFRDGAHPTAVVSPKSDPGDVGAEQLKKKIKAATSGTNRDIVVLPQDTQFHQIQINPDDSQFIELMQFTGAELAGFFGLEPGDVGVPVNGTAMQYSNRENRQQDLLQNAVNPVLEPIEEAVSELLRDGVEVKFNRSAILRTDLKARYESYFISAGYEQITGQPIITNDEIRDLEDREPLPPKETTPDE